MFFESFFGIFAAICTTFAFLPQAIRNIRRGHVKDLSLTAFSLVFLGQLSWFVYGCFREDLIIITANFISLLISLWIIVQILKKREAED